MLGVEAEMVDLNPGAGVDVEGRQRTVASFEPHCGVVVLTGGDGQLRRTTVRALVAGWGYVVVTGWRPHVLSTVDALSAQRRALADPLGVREQLLAVAAGGPREFAEMVGAVALPAVARGSSAGWWRRWRCLRWRGRTRCT